MARYIHDGTVQDGTGRVIAEATVTVYVAGGTTAATVYAAVSGGSSVGSVESDSNGYFKFFIDDSEYSTGDRFKTVITKTNYESQTRDYILIF